MFGQWDGLNEVVVFMALFTSSSVSSTLLSISSFQDLTLKMFMVCGIPLADYWVAVCLGQNMVYCWWKKWEYFCYLKNCSRWTHNKLATPLKQIMLNWLYELSVMSNSSAAALWLASLQYNGVHKCSSLFHWLNSEVLEGKKKAMPKPETIKNQSEEGCLI